ncbi:uncharacterized protein EI97DRAFT_464471 [Westerdykella ornata]|uniref:Uncharacterized protein n=1 Tax=Westerdykella ornata TaxID=318751 RepID=A0A6A6JXT6_WESOR|nr:uncharacterized protein EI97DRAFT_464471 [Westerdykella ornata]KAF2280546.1 hypothetical protein EI97DRAFT_464471 [Westerdykella ornata]
MSAFTDIIKKTLIPLTLALALYLLTTHLLLPLYRRHKTRMQYLPLPPSLSSTFTSSSPSSSTWRSRIPSALRSLFTLPSSWPLSSSRRFRTLVDGSGSRSSSSSPRSSTSPRRRSDSSLFSDQEGEDMIGFEPLEGQRRREELESRRGRADEERRLSRELEEGFRDDSDEEEEEGGDERRRSLVRGVGGMYR